MLSFGFRQQGRQLGEEGGGVIPDAAVRLKDNRDDVMRRVFAFLYDSAGEAAKPGATEDVVVPAKAAWVKAEVTITSK